MSLFINEIELDYQPRKAILPYITQYPGEPEMTEFESAFLCGVLKKHKPKKILEVGIAAGGTTAIILQCMEMLDIDNVEVHSVDYLDYLYSDKTKKAGFLGQEAEDYIKSKKVKHQFYFNDIAYSFLDEIGCDIDCLILDTTHSLPGEILDFITLLPSLKDGAIVVMHDVSRIFKKINQFATSALFSSVSGSKYINYDNGHYPNIAAFIVDKETREEIENVFLSLVLSWSYLPDEKQMKAYCKAINKLYSDELNKLFNDIYKTQINVVDYVKDHNWIPKDDAFLFPYNKVDKNQNIILYGTGNVGKVFYQKIKNNNYCNIIKWVGQNYKDRKIYGVGIESIESILDCYFDCVVIAVYDREVANEIKNDLMALGICPEKIIWSNY